MHGDSRIDTSATAHRTYEEDTDEDYRASPSDDYDFDDDKATRYGRGITASPPRGRAESDSSSGSNEKGLGITTPPRPPAHGSPSYGTPGSGGGGSGQGGRGTPAAGSGKGTPHAFI